MMDIMDLWWQERHERRNWHNTHIETWKILICEKIDARKSLFEFELYGAAENQFEAQIFNVMQWLLIAGDAFSCMKIVLCRMCNNINLKNYSIIGFIYMWVHALVYIQISLVVHNALNNMHNINQKDIEFVTCKM